MRTGGSPSPSAAPRSRWGGIPEGRRGDSPSDAAEVAGSQVPLSAPQVPALSPRLRSARAQSGRAGGGGGEAGGRALLAEAVTSPLGVGAGGAGMKGARAKVTPARPPPVATRAERGSFPRRRRRGAAGKGFPRPRSTGDSLSASRWEWGPRWGTEDAWRGGLGTRRPASVRAPGSSRLPLLGPGKSSGRMAR